MARPLYLDYNATAPLDPRVFEAMRPYFLEEFGNAGSRTHLYGQTAKSAVDKAREHVAHVVAARPEHVLFTSGATESNNIALLGLAKHGELTGKRHIVSTAIEHKSVLEPLLKLREMGFEVDLCPSTAGGWVDPDAVSERLRADTLLVSVMHGNNETGVLQPVKEIASRAAAREILVHVDAAQTFGKEVEELRSARWDFLSVSGHKIYGPKGIGALVVRHRSGQRRPLTPLMIGGGQEMGLRPGTLPVPLIVGLGAAAELAEREHEERKKTATRIRTQLLDGLEGIDFRVNGTPERTMAHAVNLSFRGVDSEALMLSLRETVAISNGAACTSASYSPSHVLRAMGLTDDEIATCVRISWGPGVDAVPVAAIREAVEQLRMD